MMDEKTKSLIMRVQALPDIRKNLLSHNEQVLIQLCQELSAELSRLDAEFEAVCLQSGRSFPLEER